MVMETIKVKTLLQKYYDGLTSQEEESMLEEYFLLGPVDPEFEADKLHFSALASMRDEEIPVPEDLETSILDALQKVQQKPVFLRRSVPYIIMSIAAGLLLMLSTFIFLNRQNQSNYITDPKIAYAESRQALELVSKYFNEGTSRLSGLGKIDQAVEPLRQFNTLDKAVKTLSNLGKSQTEK